MTIPRDVFNVIHGRMLAAIRTGWDHDDGCRLYPDPDNCGLCRTDVWLEKVAARFA